jgi:hypothetical protein
MSQIVIFSEISKFGRQCHVDVAIVMVNCLNVNKNNLSIVSENFAVNVSQVSVTKSKSRDLPRLVSIPYILYFINFAIVFQLLLS